MASEDTEPGESYELQHTSQSRVQPIEHTSTDGSVPPAITHCGSACTLEGPEIIDLPQRPPSPIEPDFSDGNVLPETPHTQPSRAWSPRIWAAVEITSSRFLVLDETIFAQIWCTLCRFCSRKSELVLKVATILALLITGISMWPSILAASDSHKSELIAEWTARKDFIENCEAHNWSSTACEKSKGIQLEAPPNLDRNEWKRNSATDHSSFMMIWTSGIMLHPLLWVPVSACLLLVVRGRLIHIFKRLCSNPSTNPPPIVDLESVHCESVPGTQGRMHSPALESGHEKQVPVLQMVPDHNSARQTALEQKPALRYRGRGPQYWYCCQCGDGPMSIAIHTHCSRRHQHERCTDCRVEYVLTAWSST